MSVVLLDTHAFVWALSQPELLGPAALSVVLDRTTRLMVSAASLWETSIKVASGKWPEAELLVAEFEELVESLGATPVSIDPRHARTAGLMSWQHRDPFDRMLAAQATLERWPLVTRDAEFADVPGLAIIW